MTFQLHDAGTFLFITMHDDELAAKNDIVQPLEFYNFCIRGFLKSANQCTHFKSRRLAESVLRRLQIESIPCNLNWIDKSGRLL